MTGRILIIDAVATNRIVLKVKMLSAQFDVDACPSVVDAKKAIAANRPDLILVNLADPVEDRHGFCKALKSDISTSGIGMIAVGIADTSRARFAALDAGADDVLPHPINDTLLLARIRSLLRVRSAYQELVLRDSTSTALGFEEAKASFLAPAHVTLLTQDEAGNPALLHQLNNSLDHPVRATSRSKVLANKDLIPTPDLFIIDCAMNCDDLDAMYRLVSDLNCRTETRLSSKLVIVSPEAPHVAGMFLDLGADDIVMSTASDGEVALRATALITRKLVHDKLRDTVRDGLQAAVTDPLTGLYNRRYVTPHLSRMASQTATNGQVLAIMMLDIDHFKAINDNYGHSAGDDVLVQLSARLRENLRGSDLVARMSGEEFLVAMPRANAADAQSAADRLRRIVNERPFDIGHDVQKLRVTVSVGVALQTPYQVANPDLTEICEQADAALYDAKSAGRNQVAMSKSAA